MLSREKLIEYDICTLRILGAKIGVKSPTTLNKHDLINDIIEIDSGELEPCFSKFGRPSKNTLSLPSELEALFSPTTCKTESFKEEKRLKLALELEDVARQLKRIIEEFSTVIK